MKPATRAYIGINSDGRVRAIVFDDEGYEKETAKIVAQWITMGRKVERLPVQQACDRMKSGAVET